MRDPDPARWRMLALLAVAELLGVSLGTVVGALTIGKALPYLVHAIPGAGERPVVLVASASAALAACLVLFAYRDGPYPFPRRPFAWGLVAAVFHGRRWRLAMGG